MTRRALLLVAMGGFLVMAIATPNAFGDDGLAFGLAYLVVVVVHLVLFAFTFPRERALREVLQVAPYNLASAVLLIIAGFVDGAADWWLWGAAAPCTSCCSSSAATAASRCSQAHFVERNGVVLIVALGESMVSLSLGLGEHALSPAVLLAATSSASPLAASLWSLYFLDADERRTARASNPRLPRPGCASRASRTRMPSCRFWRAS